MHLYAITRGIKHDVDKFVTQMQGKYLPMDIAGKPALVQLAMRPVQLWEIVFPEPCLQNVLNSLEDPKYVNPRIENMPIKALRKMLKAKKCPLADGKANVFPVYRENVGIHIIGIKEDARDAIDGHEML